MVSRHIRVMVTLRVGSVGRRQGLPLHRLVLRQDRPAVAVRVEAVHRHAARPFRRGRLRTLHVRTHWSVSTQSIALCPFLRFGYQFRFETPLAPRLRPKSLAPGWGRGIFHVRGSRLGVVRLRFPRRIHGRLLRLVLTLRRLLCKFSELFAPLRLRRLGRLLVVIIIILWRRVGLSLEFTLAGYVVRFWNGDVTSFIFAIISFATRLWRRFCNIYVFNERLVWRRWYVGFGRRFGELSLRRCWCPSRMSVGAKCACCGWWLSRVCSRLIEARCSRSYVIGVLFPWRRDVGRRILL